MREAQEVVLYAEFTAVRGASDQVEELISAFAEVVRAEPGNIRFDVYRRAEAPDRFFVFETYRDRTAFNHHLAEVAGRDFNDALRHLIIESASQLSFLHPSATT